MVTKSKAPTTLEEASEAVPAADTPVDAAAEVPADSKPEEAKPDGGSKKKKKGKKEPAAEGAEAEADGVKKKKVKKVVPSWATLDDVTRSKLAKGGSLAKPKLVDAIVEAIKMCGDGKGICSASAIKSMVMSENPDLPKVSLKKGMAKAVDKGLVVQVKGKGFSGSFKLGKSKPEKKAEKKAEAGGKKGKKKESGPKPAEPLENLFPLVFTWACNPKEASVGFIKKYLVANYPDIDLGVELKTYKKALVAAENNGQLERLTGQGFSGTFRLVDGAKKSGSKFDDAFENALIAMNDPKDLSVSKLRDYLGFYHPEYKTDDRPIGLKRALDRAVEKGWLRQISGKGFTGTYRVMHPYYPSPRELWGADFVEEKEKAAPKEKKETASPKKKAAKKAKAASSDSEDDEDEDEEEEAYKPSPKKRGAPTPRKTAEPAAKKAKTVTAKKTKAAKPVVAKKSKPPKAAKGAAKKGRGKK